MYIFATCFATSWYLFKLYIIFCMASFYSLLPFVPSALFYRESCLLYPLHLTFYFKDSLHAVSKAVRRYNKKPTYQSSNLPFSDV